MAESVATFSKSSAPRPAERATSAPSTAGVAASVLCGVEAIESYVTAVSGMVFAPPQSPDWVRIWSETVNPDVVIGLVRRHGRTLFALPLEVVSVGPFKVARFPGGSHANGNFPPTDRIEQPLASDIEALVAAIARERRDIDLIVLERLCPERDALDNPLLAMPHAPSPDGGLAVNLEGGFDGVLGRVSGKRKRKKYRSQLRKFEAVGTVDVGRASSAAETAALLDTFFALKSERLKSIGADDVFGDEKVRVFFKRLFGEAAECSEPAFLIDRVTVAGVVRAITGSSLCGDRLICDFSAISDDELTQWSPGDFLFYENIAAACAAGRAIFDFSVGDERYKREWCDIETIYADIRMPLGFKGALLAGSIAARSGMVRFVKSRPRLWSLIRRLRRRRAEPVPAPNDDTPASEP